MKKIVTSVFITISRVLPRILLVNVWETSTIINYSDYDDKIQKIWGILKVNTTKSYLNDSKRKVTRE